MSLVAPAKQEKNSQEPQNPPPTTGFNTNLKSDNLKSDITLFPDDAEDVSVIYDDRTKDRQSAQLHDSDDHWSRNSSPRSMLSLSAWTQTTNNTFEYISRTRESPLPFFDAKFDDESVTSSLNSRALLNNTLHRVTSPPQKKVYMNAMLRAELSPTVDHSAPPPSPSFSANNSIISATPSQRTQGTSSSSQCCVGEDGVGLHNTRSELNQAMIRGESFLSVSLSASPSVEGTQECVTVQESDSESVTSSYASTSQVVGSAFNTTRTQQKKKKLSSKNNDENNASMTLNSSLSTIHTINTVTSFNTAQTLNLSTGLNEGTVTSDSGIRIQTDVDRTVDSTGIITPLSTGGSTKTMSSALNRAFFEEKEEDEEDDEEKVQADTDDIVSSAPDRSMDQTGTCDSMPVDSSLSTVPLERNVSSFLDEDSQEMTVSSYGATEVSGQSWCATVASNQTNVSALNRGFVVHGEDSDNTVSPAQGMEMKQLEETTLSDSLPLMEDKPQLLAGGSWDDEYSNEKHHETDEMAVRTAFLNAGMSVYESFFLLIAGVVMYRYDRLIIIMTVLSLDLVVCMLCS